MKVRIGIDGTYYRFESNAKTLIGTATPGAIMITIQVEAEPNITIKAPEAARYQPES